MNRNYDIVVVGSGPAGISASLYAKRGGASVAIVSKGASALIKADKIENYYGVEAGIDAKQLYANGLNQAKALGIDIWEEEVVSIDMMENFVVLTAQGQINAKSVIIATGSNRKTVPIKGLEKFEGQGVSYCAVCDAFFYRQKVVAILGNGDYALHELETLRNMTSKQYILTNGQEPQADFGQATVITSKIVNLNGQDSLESISFENGENIQVNGLFLALGQAGAVNFARKMGIVVQDNHIIVDNIMQTNIEGIFSAGDCNGGFLQISKAVYEGAVAGTNALKFIKTKK